MSIPASAAREKLFPLIQEVNENSSSVLITSKNGNAVLVSQSEYEGLIETLHLLSTPANAKALFKGIDEAKSGKGVTFSSVDEATEFFMGKRSKAAPAKRVKKRVVAKKRVRAKVR